MKNSGGNLVDSRTDFTVVGSRRALESKVRASFSISRASRVIGVVAVVNRILERCDVPPIKEISMRGVASGITERHSIKLNK